MAKSIPKELEECLKDVGTLKVSGENADILEGYGIPKSKQTFNMMLAIATYENAIEGNSKYFDLVLSVLGSKQSDKLAKEKVEIEKEKMELERLKNDVIVDEEL